MRVSRRQFYTGFGGGLFLFGIANAVSYLRLSYMVDGFCGYGFPFQMYEAVGGFLHDRGILWGGPIANISTALASSLLLGFLRLRLFGRRPRFR